MTVHILNPLVGDGDKCCCNVRLSGNPARKAAKVPTDVECEICFIRVLRTWQVIDEDIDPDPRTWPGWPWDDPRYTRPTS